MDHVIATEGLRRRFGRLDAVNHLTLHVPAGSIFGLIGPNGAGKTTTLKLLMNIIRPTAGRAEVLGVDSQRLGPAEFAKIGYVSENQRMPDWMTVRQLLAYCKPFYPAWDDRLSARLIELMALPLDRKIRHLSRGMRMKAALVSSLAYRPKLLILDEPFSGLDPLMRDEFVQGVLELAGEGGWSAVISSHDLEDIERLIDWVGYLRDGQLAFSESITGLQARFRQIDVSLPTAPADAPRRRQMRSAHARARSRCPRRFPRPGSTSTTGDRAVRFVHARLRAGSDRAGARRAFSRRADPGDADLLARNLHRARAAGARRVARRESHAAKAGDAGTGASERRKAGAFVKLVAHLIRKDLRAIAVVALIWIFLMAIEVALQLTGAAARPRSRGAPSPLQMLQIFLPFAEVAVAVLIVSLVIHEDPLVDARAFWLTRPIPRGQLFLAKLITIALVILAPALAALGVLLAWYHVPPVYMMRAGFEVVLWLALPAAAPDRGGHAHVDAPPLSSCCSSA